MKNDRKKLCIIMGGHFSAQMGGAQYQVKCILDELVKTNNFEIFYLTRTVDPGFKAEGYKIIKIADPNGLRKYSCIFDSVRLYKLLSKIKPEVIYQRVLGAYTGVAAYYGKKHACKVIYHVSSDYNLISLRARGRISLNPLVHIENCMGEYGLRNADHVVSQTRHQSDMFRNKYRRDVSLVMSNFHPPSIEEIDKDATTIKVVWIANFKKVKRPEIFVKLAGELQELANLELLMLGRPGGERLYKELHKRIRETKNLRYLGEQPHSAVNELLAKAHILVNTSIVEGFSNTFIQAWMRKVPVVTLSVNPDGVFNDGMVGFCTGSYEGLRATVIRLIEDKHLRTLIGEQAKKFAEQNYSVQNVEKLLSLLY